MNNKVKFNVPEEGIVNELPPVETDAEEVEVIDAEGSEDTIDDSTQEHFYADGVYAELRDVIQDTDFRLFLIGNDLVMVGMLEGNTIQFLDLVGDEGEEEFVMKDAPLTLQELLDFKTIYNITNTEIDTEGLEVVEAPHERIVEYILNLKVADGDAEDVEDDEAEIEALEKEEENDESNEQE